MMTFHYCWRAKFSFKLVLDGIYLPMQLTDWLLVEVALQLIGLTQISSVKNWLSPSRKRSIVGSQCTRNVTRQLPVASQFPLDATIQYVATFRHLKKLLLGSFLPLSASLMVFLYIF
jgi:hypothetical protein